MLPRVRPLSKSSMKYSIKFRITPGKSFAQANINQGQAPAEDLPPFLRDLRLLQFDINAILDLVHGEADAGGITAFVKMDSAQRGLHVFGFQGIGDGIVIR